MDYGEVLKHSWNTVWKYKILWIFGILAGTGFGGGSNGGGGSGARNHGSDNGSAFTQIFPWMEDFARQFTRFVEQIPWWVYVVLAVVFVFLILLSVFLTTIGKIALIRGSWQVDEGAVRLSFGELFKGSLPYFWRVFFLNLLVGLAVFLLVILLMIPLVATGVLTMGVGLLVLAPFYLLLFCLLIPFGWLVQMLINQASVAIVGENTGIQAGLQKGFQVIQQNLGKIIVMALILFIGGWVAGFLIAIPAVALVVPVLPGLILGSQGILQGGLIITAVIFLVYLPFAIVASGILSAYIHTAWTLTYRRLTGRMQAVAVAAEPLPVPLA